MATRLTFEKRVEDAKGYVEKKEIKKAISTLKKAIANNPEKDVDKKVELWIVALEKELLELTEKASAEGTEKPKEETKEVTKPFVLSFIDRIENAKEFIADGKPDRAIATLKIAVEENPEAENIEEIKLWIAELEKKPEEKVEEEIVPDTEVEVTEIVKPDPDENLEKEEVVKSDKEEKLTAEDLEVITFRVTAPFMRNCVPFEVGDTLELPRKNDQLNIEPVE